MKLFQIVTLFSDYFQSSLSKGLLAQALENRLIEVSFVNPRDFSTHAYKQIDDKPFGGGPGMVMSYDPLKQAVESLKDRGRVIYLSPRGKLWNAKRAREMAENEETLTLVCGRYAGVDERWVREFADEEIFNWGLCSKWRRGGGSGID